MRTAAPAEPPLQWKSASSATAHQQQQQQSPTTPTGGGPATLLEDRAALAHKLQLISAAVEQSSGIRVSLPRVSTAALLPPDATTGSSSSSNNLATMSRSSTSPLAFLSPDVQLVIATLGDAVLARDSNYYGGADQAYYASSPSPTTSYREHGARSPFARSAATSISGGRPSTSSTVAADEDAQLNDLLLAMERRLLGPTPQIPSASTRTNTSTPGTRRQSVSQSLSVSRSSTQQGGGGGGGAVRPSSIYEGSKRFSLAIPADLVSGIRARTDSGASAVSASSGRATSAISPKPPAAVVKTDTNESAAEARENISHLPDGWTIDEFADKRYTKLRKAIADMVKDEINYPLVAPPTLALLLQHPFTLNNAALVRC